MGPEQSLSRPSGGSWMQLVQAIAAAPFHFIERMVVRGIRAPVKPIWRRLDAYSYKFENTLMARIIAVGLFPLLLVSAVWTGLLAVENGIGVHAFALAFFYMIGVGVIMAPLERLMPWTREWLEQDDAGVDVLMFLTVIPAGALISVAKVFVTASLVGLIHTHYTPETIKAFWPTALHPVLQVVLLIVVMDFFRYWYHRWMHEVPFMWRWHSVHHSSTRLYWFNGARSHPLESFVQELIWVVPYALIQAPAEIVFVAGLASRIIGKFQHTALNTRHGFMEYIFSGPMNHRYHHAKSAEEGNTNYGGDIVLWDHLFGTFYLPKGKVPSSDIGCGYMPDYPRSWLGLMMAPFRIQLWRDAKARKEAAMKEVEAGNTMPVAAIPTGARE